jgi:hypothetical protein
MSLCKILAFGHFLKISIKVIIDDNSFQVKGGNSEGSFYPFYIIIVNFIIFNTYYIHTKINNLLDII